MASVFTPPDCQGVGRKDMLRGTAGVLQGFEVFGLCMQKEATLIGSISVSTYIWRHQRSTYFKENLPSLAKNCTFQIVYFKDYYVLQCLFSKDFLQKNQRKREQFSSISKKKSRFIAALRRIKYMDCPGSPPSISNLKYSKVVKFWQSVYLLIGAYLVLVIYLDLQNPQFTSNEITILKLPLNHLHFKINIIP